jgi:hypothetical protein
MAQAKSKATADRRGGISLKTFVVVFVVGAIISVVAVMYGRSDGGVINVAGVIAQTNAEIKQKADAGEDAPPPVVDTRAKKSNGGLVGMGQSAPAPKPKKAPVAKASTTNASSTESAATTTNQDATTTGG